MRRHVNGWLLNGVCFVYGIVRVSDWIEGNTILDILVIVGFCYAIYLTKQSMKEDDDLRWLISLLSDTGMRLGEGVGLLKSDINLNSKMPHINLVPHPWRRLKTKGSERCIPLVGASLWACERILKHNNDSIYAFPRYTSVDNCNANSASAALNKWLKEQLTDDYVIHGFRHSFRDRLRAVECPLEIIDQLGGWSSKSVGQGYGKGYELEVLYKWIGVL